MFHSLLAASSLALVESKAGWTGKVVEGQMKPSSENLVPKPQGSEVSNLVTYIPPGSNWSPDSRGTFTRETHNPVREAGPAATKHLGDESGTAHKPALCGARFGATEPGMTWPLRRPSAVPFPVFHPGCALSGPLAAHLQKGPRKWGRSGRLTILHQGLLNPAPGTPPPPAWPWGQTALRMAREHRFHPLSRSSRSSV